MANPIVLIPARMNASRLPGKPLADIHGAPMIVHVWRRAMEADVGPVWVAADDRARHRRRSPRPAGNAVMTRSDHPSGSDRIFEALGAVDPDGDHDVVVNIQGDLPTIEPSVVRACLAPLDDAAVDIATLATPITREQEKDDPNVVKVVGDRTRSDPVEGALFHPRSRAVGRGRAVAPYRPLRLSPRRASSALSACPVAARAAREARTIAGAGGGHADRRRARRNAPLGVDAPEDLERAREMLAPGKYA